MAKVTTYQKSGVSPPISETEKSGVSPPISETEKSGVSPPVSETEKRLGDVNRPFFYTISKKLPAKYNFSFSQFSF